MPSEYHAHRRKMIQGFLDAMHEAGDFCWPVVEIINPSVGFRASYKVNGRRVAESYSSESPQFWPAHQVYDAGRKVAESMIAQIGKQLDARRAA